MLTSDHIYEEEPDSEFQCHPDVPKHISKLIDRFGNRFLFTNGGDIWLPPLPIGKQNSYPGQLRKVQEMSLRDDDILICSYPKTGLHWHLEILKMLTNNKIEYTSKEHFEKTYLEFNTSALTDTGTEDDDGKPRILHTHLPFRYIPRDVLKKKTKVIVLLRNPKDTMTSLYCQTHAVKPPFNYTGTFEQFVFLLLECGFHYGAIFEYLMDFQRGWEEHPNVPVFTSVFEDMKRNPLDGIRRLNTFVGSGCSDEFCRQVAHACEFKRVKSHKESNADALQQLIYRKGSVGFYRKGDVGDWKNWFTVALNEIFDEECKKRMHGYKTEFQYE